MKSFQLILTLVVAAVGTAIISPAHGSDHDDGEIDLKGRALNITDVYTFREDNQSDRAGDRGNLVIVMNTNPRGLPSQQYYYSTQARYEIHVGRVSDAATRPTGKADITFRYTFSEPSTAQTQEMILTVIKDGVETVVSKTTANSPILTTSIAKSKLGALTNNQVWLDGNLTKIFAGARQDPFFFDVNRFFEVRAAAVQGGGFIGFRSPATAQDFTQGLNVNALVMSVPINYLQGSGETVYDVWSTISVPAK